MSNFGLGTWPRRRARIDPATVALRQDDRELTYRELADRVDALAGSLESMGVARGDRIAYLGTNDIATFELFFATTLIGAIFVPLNWRLAPPEIAYLVSDCRPALLVHQPEFAVDGLATRCVATGAPFEELLTGAARPEADVDLHDDAVILYTSGTTGRPKGAVLTHANLTFNTMNQLAHADVLSTDTAMCVSPLFHATGLGQVSLPTLFKGGTVVVVAKFEPAAVLATIAAQRIASFSAVPTMLQLLAEHADFSATDLSGVRFVIYGGSPVLASTAAAWQQRSVPLLQGYGMTEASPGVTMAAAHGVSEHPVSIGVPHFFTDVALDAGTDELTERGTGELVIRGPNVFRGYWERPEDTADALRGGWYRSGDIVTVADDGWADVVDRVKDLIISGGENVYPSEVELALRELPGVVDVAVVAVGDERWGEVPAAFVVAADDAQWTTQSLTEALAGRIAPFKIPKFVAFVDSLPKTATGKVRREILRARAASPNEPPEAVGR